jgi:hypothetical protein
MEKFTTTNGRQPWHRLEEVLDAYIDIIGHSKIKPVDDDFEYEGPSDRRRPWIFYDYSEAIMQRTVTAFNELVQAIEERMPHHEPRDSSDDNPLVDASVLDEAQIEGFAKEFLSRVRGTRIKYLAPGVLVPTAEHLFNQPYRDSLSLNAESRPPILLFPGDQTVQRIVGSFDRQWKYADEYPSGLYLTPYETGGLNTFEDSTRFILLFRIGAHGFAKTSDMALIGEDVEAEEAVPKDLHDKLYAPGYNPYIEMHEMQLYRVLESSGEMVTDGDWDVDESGVVGGMEKFRDADTEEYWLKYVIAQDW